MAARRCSQGAALEVPPGRRLRQAALQQRELFGMALVAAGKKGARPEQETKPARCFRRLPKQGGQLAPAVGAGSEPAQAEQAEVGVRRLGEPVEQQRHHGLHQAGGPREALCQLHDGVSRPPGVGEAERGQALADRALTK